MRALMLLLIATLSFCADRTGPKLKSVESIFVKGNNQAAEKARESSAVTSKPANGGHPKTGQWKTPFGQHLLYPAQPRSGKEF